MDVVVDKPAAAILNSDPNFTTTTPQSTPPTTIAPTTAASTTESAPNKNPISPTKYQASHMSDDEFDAYIEAIIRNLQSEGYGKSPGIHSLPARNFYKNILGANAKVLQMLETGYIPKFKSNPPKAAFHKNNRSARENISFCKEKTAQWLTQGIVSRVETRPFVTNPLTVSTKRSSSTGEIKLRQCLDLSREVNDTLAEMSVSMEDLNDVIPRIQPGAWMTAIDLAQMYTHLSIHPSFRSLFGFSLPSDSGGSDYFVFNTLPFGTGEINFFLFTSSVWSSTRVFLINAHTIFNSFTN